MLNEVNLQVFEGCPIQIDELFGERMLNYVSLQVFECCSIQSDELFDERMLNEVNLQVFKGCSIQNELLFDERMLNEVNLQVFEGCQPIIYLIAYITHRKTISQLIGTDGCNIRKKILPYRYSSNDDRTGTGSSKGQVPNYVLVEY